MNMKIGKQKPLILQRWWLRVRKCKPNVYKDGSTGACSEFYIPLWSWPFELLHRLIFGSTKFEITN